MSGKAFRNVRTGQPICMSDCFRPPWRRRSFKVEGQELRSGAVPRVESGAKPLVRVWGEAPEADDTFVKICYFVTVLRMTVIFAFIAYKCSIGNGRKINFEAEKWYRTSYNACRLGTKSGRATAWPPCQVGLAANAHKVRSFVLHSSYVS